MTYIDWVKNKINTAFSLANGECGGTYDDGVIILSAAISAMASDVWRGSMIYKKRFIEIIKDYCDEDLNPTHISMPLLIRYLRNNGKASEAELLQNKFMNFDENQILHGNEIDKNEDEIKAICPSLSLKDIRRYAYPNILYEEVRSSLMHEYQVGRRADSHPMIPVNKNDINYSNWINSLPVLVENLLEFFDSLDNSQKIKLCDTINKIFEDTIKLIPKKIVTDNDLLVTAIEIKYPDTFLDDADKLENLLNDIKNIMGNDYPLIINKISDDDIERTIFYPIKWKNDKHIYFPIEWIGQVVESVATNISNRNTTQINLLKPISWWVDG